MAHGVGASCLKYLLFFFNLLFLVTGLLILGIGVHATINSKPYMDYISLATCMIFIGIVVFFVTFLGCCGAINENRCMLLTFALVLIIIFLVELAVGIASFVMVSYGDDPINIENTVLEYDKDPAIKRTVDIIQTELKCCGVHGPADWPTYHSKIPDTCCESREVVDGVTMPCTELSPFLYRQGCLQVLKDHRKEVATYLGGVGIGVAVVQGLGVAFAYLLARSVRDQYQTV